MHKNLFFIQEPVAIFAFGNFAAVNLFFADDRKLHTAL